MCRCWESCWTWRRERKKNNILAETQDSDAKTKKGVDKIIRLSYNRCRWFKQTGEMAEWFMALVLKTSDTARYRGFESHPLRQQRNAASNIAFRGCEVQYFYNRKQSIFCINVSREETADMISTLLFIWQKPTHCVSFYRHHQRSK